MVFAVRFLKIQITRENNARKITVTNNTRENFVTKVKATRENNTRENFVTKVKATTDQPEVTKSQSNRADKR